MAMTTDEVDHQNHHRSSSGAGDPINSPSKRNNLPSPWVQVVRREPESAKHAVPTSVTISSPAPLTEQSQPVENHLIEGGEASNGSNAARPKKPAWKQPAAGNGMVEVSVSPGTVMGAVSWPALLESTKPSPKSSHLIPTVESSTKALPDGSLPNSQGPVIPHSPHKQGSGQLKSSSLQNHMNTMPARHRSVRRGGGGSVSGGNGSSNSGSLVAGHSQNSFPNPSQAPPPPPFPMLPLPSNGFSNSAPTMLDLSPRNYNWEPRAVVPQLSVVNDQRHSSRRGGPRIDGPHQNNVGRRRDQEHGHHGNIRDANVQRGSPRGFPWHPPPSIAAVVPPQPLRPPYNPMGYNEIPYVPSMPMDPFGVPYIGRQPAFPFAMPVPDPLSTRIIKQIEYYFSNDNLAKDNFLRSNMDDQGWVPITLIAGFNRVKSMTNNIHMILDSLRTSTVLEVQDDKVRSRNDWIRWIPSSGRILTDASLQSPGARGYDTLTTSFQNIFMEDAAADLSSMTAKLPSVSKDVPFRHLSEQVSQQEGTESTNSSF